MGALSKGCGTCKSRKIKCDETHPQCTRCRNAGVECSGYALRLRFVHEESRIRRSMATSLAQFDEFSTATNSVRRVSQSRNHDLRPSNTAIFLTDTLPLTAFKDDIFTSYLLFKLFEGGEAYPLNPGKGPRCGITADWIPELLHTTHRPRQKSWDALAAVVYGQAHSIQQVRTDALKLYGQALLEFRTRLLNPDERFTDCTLASMTALYMHEVIDSFIDFK